ncbi:autophagy-related protein 13 homolog isoform X1 [Tribolium castaneum]|uniref:Autophagy-related protein 13 n=1 Tax=Tribolium castaneum TaxID=7070 RepID=D6WFS6_TRICA|nr:PREDICTED: autophagy-related protein 13 homolog isoform X1 [Tribolium castaneum]EEZ99590.2 Autophagy-related protein 13 homolog-like Protein [Tribolium castaneum]|eukprot:XP_008200081.1 PREDICTED: autophagy-related protein 13 homolog isoform X1 [Tribolium castaneum]
MKLSVQETKDLHKYTKFFALKSAQVIIQSRVAERISTQCKPNTQGTDWFNLHINDHPDVIAETKKALNGEIISPCFPLCIEISLRTSEGDQMTLESWCLSLLPEQCDPTLKNIPSVYNRMGLLLKSLLSVTRVTPAYKLSRMQGADSYVMCYRIYLGQPVLHSLGEDYKQTRIGQICTPIGTLQFSVAYRTKMTISPTQTGKNSIMVKSDHFNSNSNTRRHRNGDDINDLTKPMRPGPFADPKPKKTVEPQLPGVTRLLAMGKNKPRPTKNSENAENEVIENPRLIEEDESSKKEISNSPTKSIPKMTSSNSSRLSIFSNLKSVDEEYWMQELSAPFANRGPMGELMQFYKQCKKSPPLQSPQKNPTPEEITEMIKMYESQLPEYDALVQSFCESPDNN